MEAGAKYSKKLPSRIRERYEAFLAMPGYIELRNEIALMEAEVEEYNDRLTRGDNPEWRDAAYQAVKKTLQTFQKEYDRSEKDEQMWWGRMERLKCKYGLDTADEEFRERLWKELSEDEQEIYRLTDTLYHRVSAERHAMQQQVETLQIVVTIFDQQYAIDDSYAKRQQAIDLLRRLKETEVKRMVAANQVLTISESHALIVRISSFIEEWFTEPTQRMKAVRELMQLLERKGSRPALPSPREIVDTHGS